MSQFNFEQQKNIASGMLAGSVAFNLLLIVALVAALLRGPGTAPEPPVPQDVVSVMEQAERTRLVMEADASEEIARKIVAGEIKNSNQLYTWAKAYQEKIDETAYEQVNKLNQQILAERDTGWTQEQIKQIEQFQSDKAEGKRRVAQ